MDSEETDALTALRRGDIAGLGILVRRYQLPALRLAYSLCGDQQVAEDAVADAFLAVHEHIGRYDPARPFKPWFYRIVLNAVRAAGRRDRRAPTVPDAPDILGRHADPGPGPEAQALQHELDAALLREIDRLPRKQREVIILRYYLDLDERAMAAILGVPAGTVKWRLFQARNRLRGQLGDGADRYPLTAEERQHV